MREEIDRFSKIHPKIMLFWLSKESLGYSIKVATAGVIEIFYLTDSTANMNMSIYGSMTITNRDILATFDGQKLTYFCESYIGTHYTEEEFLRLLKMKAFI